jgi:hypothetical protein
VAADFFTVEVWTRRGLQRFIVLFFIELSTRKVEIAGIASVANGLWMSQIGRNETPLNSPALAFVLSSFAEPCDLPENAPVLFSGPYGIDAVLDQMSEQILGRLGVFGGALGGSPFQGFVTPILFRIRDSRRLNLQLWEGQRRLTCDYLLLTGLSRPQASHVNLRESTLLGLECNQV